MITLALKEFVLTRKRRNLMELAGKIEFRDDYDYFSCRKKGITVRSTIHCLIAQIVLEHDLFLLHNDMDFEYMAPVIGLNPYPV